MRFLIAMRDHTLEVHDLEVSQDAPEGAEIIGVINKEGEVLPWSGQITCARCGGTAHLSPIGVLCPKCTFH